MSFTVRRIEDPTIHVRRNIKPDILGISSAWDNIVDIKQSLSRLEDDVVAANKRPKLAKNTRFSDGKVLKEISRETQQLGKVTRFQLLDEKPRQSGYTLPKVEARKIKGDDWSTVSDISTIEKVSYSGLNKEKDGYSPTRYTGGTKSTIRSERPTYFETTTVHPTILNDPPSIRNDPPLILNDSPPSKDSSFSNTSATSSSSQQFSVTSSPSFHGKTVLARNEAALQKIKEKVRKQKEMLSKTEESRENELGDRKLHESTDHVSTSGETRDKSDAKPAIPLKRKVGTISAAGPTYKGFNAVSEPKQKKIEKQRVPTKISKEAKEKTSSKPRQEKIKEKKPTKGKMTRIVGSKRPQEVITTTSWRDGQANVKRILNAKKAKISDKQSGKTEKPPAKSEKASVRAEKGPLKNDKPKADATYDVESEDELSEGRLSSDEDVIGRFNAKIEKFEAEKDVLEIKDEPVRPSVNVSIDSDDQNESKMKDVLSREAKSMLVDLAKDSSESETEPSKETQGEKPKSSPPKKKAIKTRKPTITQKPSEDIFPKGKTRHYDQAAVQKYMAHQLAERKKKQKQEKMQKKKQEEEKQQRLKDLYERQKKSFAPTKKDKRLGKTFSFGNFDVHIPGKDEFHPGNNEEFEKDQVGQSTNQNESDKENTDIDDTLESSRRDISSDSYTEDADVTLTEEMLTNQGSQETQPRRIPAVPVVVPAPSTVPSTEALDQRAQRLTALQATALALQSRLQSHALRLSGAKEGALPQPKVSPPPKEVESGFQGVLPGVVNIRKQADENEKQSTREAAATKIQAAYRGHTVRKRQYWNEEKTTSKRNGNTAQELTTDYTTRDTLGVHELQPSLFLGSSHGVRLDPDEARSEGSSDDVHFRELRPFYDTERLNNNLQRTAPKVGRKYDELRARSNFLRNDFSAPPVTHFTAPPRAHFEPKGDRFSVMNIFSRRHPTLPIEDILNEEPGSETASLLDVNRGKISDHNMEYEDDFTDASSVITEEDLKKDASKAETYSECFETDEDTDTKHSRPKEKGKTSRSSSQGLRNEQRSLQEEREKRQLTKNDERSKTTPLSEDDNVLNRHQNDFVFPVMASTMQPDTRSSPSISPSEENEPIRRRYFMPRHVDRGGGDRLSPDSLQRKFTAEINLLENVEDSVRQLSDIERTRGISLAQQETVSLAQILKAKQQSHEQEMRNLRLKAKEEASQAAMDLEKTRQAAAVAAASAAEKLAEVQTEAIKTNAEHSRKYMEEATRMTSDLLSNTSNQLAQFCKNLTTTTGAAVEDLHKTRRPTTTLVERGTSISERHTTNSEPSSISDERTRTSDVISNQSKSFESSPSVTSPRQQAGYSSDEFESYKSQTVQQDGSDIKTADTDHPSLSAESIAEDLPEKSVSEDTTIQDELTAHDESGNDARDSLPRQLSSKAHDSVSSVLDYSSQFDDSSHALTDEDIDFNFLLPSREHRRKSMRRIKDISFDEDKRKDKSVRTLFESDDSFGKFTADMIQQYVHEEEVRTKHQATILRLREKSLKDKTKAELHWLEQMKKQSRDKGSDDVMPSIKKRERGIKMKLKAEKEEIKCLRAANRAASFQRRFMIYQQQEIQRLHQATLSIRERIQKDTSRKGSDHSSNEPSQSHPRTSSPLSKPKSNTQSTPETSGSKSKTNQSPSAKSVSEDISGEHGSSHASPNTTGSSFPSYSTPKSEVGKQEQASTSARGQHEPETSTILNMLSTVDAGAEGASTRNGELLKIHKMLLERQKKLVKDESEVNSMLQKVTEMLKNQKNLSNQSENAISETSQSKSSIPEASQSGRRVADASESRRSKASGKSPSEQSIPEEISSIAKSVSEEIKPGESAADKTANDYDHATFESDDSTTRSRRSTMSQRVTPQNGEVNIEDETFSLTETSDHSDMEERVRRLNEVLEREKKKAEALERKKRKLKRSAMKKEVMKLEIEIQNTKDDNYRKLAEIKTASAAVQSTTPTMATPVKPRKTSPLEDTFPRENRKKSSQRSGDYTTPVSGNTSLVSDRGVRSSSHEIEESFIEVLDDSPKSVDGTKRPTLSETSSIQTESQASEKLHSNEIEESVAEIIEVDSSTPAGEKGMPPTMTPPKELPEPRPLPVLAEDDVSEISEHISEHSRSSASIPEQVPSVGEEEASKSSEIPEELSERSYTPIPSEASVSEDSRVGKDAHSQVTSPPDQSPKSVEDTTSKAASYSYGDDTFENSYTEPKSHTSIQKGSANIEDLKNKANVTEDVKISPENTPSISEHLTASAERSPRVSEHLTRPGKRSASVSDEPSYTEPESDRSVSDKSLASHRPKSKSEDKNLTSDKREHSDASDISKNLLSDEISQKSRTSSRRSKTQDERSDKQPTSKSISEKQKSLKQGEAKVSPRESPRDLAVDDIGSGSEISSIAEEIPSGYEDVSEGEDVLKDKKLIFRDHEKDERISARQSGLDISGETELDQVGLDKSELEDDEVEETASKPKESEIDKHETELVKPVLDNSDSQVDHGETILSGETAADIVVEKQTSQTDRSSKSPSSRSSPDERSKGSEDEQQYSDDFDDASIPEEISEIGEEFSEKGEDSDKGENFAVFVTSNKSSEERLREIGLEPRENKEESREDKDQSREHKSQTRVKRITDDITDVLCRDIVADTVTTMKKLKTKKLQEKTTSDKNDGENSLTKAFSTVTRTLVDKERPLDTRGVISEHDDTQDRYTDTNTSDEAAGYRSTKGRLDSAVDTTATDRVTDGYVGTELDETTTDGSTDRQLDTRASAAVTQEHIGSQRVTDGQSATDRNKEAHLATDRITKDLLADAIMQMIEIKRRKEKNIATAVQSKPKRTASAPQLSTATGETLPEKIPVLTGTTSPVNVSEVETPVDDEKAINNALLVAKTNQVLDDDALRSIDDDIAGLLGTSVDDEDEFPVNVTNFSADPPSDNETSLPEYAPMFAVPHSAQELTPMVNSTVDVLLEQRRLGRPLEDCVPQAQFLAGETESELGSVSIQSYRHLVFDLTKEVFIDTVSQNEPATRPLWAKAKWKGGQKLSRHFKRWKSDEEIRATVLERVTNVIGLGAPRATMATIPRKTPVRGNKKDNVDAILIEELRQEEPLWTDYEEDETTVKFQVADAILNMLLEDTARVFNAIQAKKNVPDDVLVV